MVILINPAPAGWQSRGWVDGKHRGIDYGWLNANPAGSKKVVAAAAGTVESVADGGAWNSGWGNRIVIVHAGGCKTTYNHLKNRSMQVTPGQTIAAGQHLATMGNTGDSDGDHLHFELLVNGSRVDPAPFFSKHLPGSESAAPAPASLGTGQRRAIARANRRAEPTTKSADLGDDLKVNAIGNFVGFIRGESVNGNNIWLKGIRGQFFHSGSFEGGANTAGLTDLGTWGAPAAPKPAPVPVSKRPHVRITEPWWVYATEHGAYHAIVAERRGLAPAGTYPITDHGNEGRPVQIPLDGIAGVRHAGRYWIGSSRTAAPIVHI